MGKRGTRTVDKAKRSRAGKKGDIRTVLSGEPVREKADGSETAKNNPMRIFVSHRREDQQVAQRVAHLLFSLSDDYEPWFSSQIPTGADWYEEIIKELGQSKMFLLLFRDPSEQWDWCLYEAGIFEPRPNEPDKHVVYLYTAGTTPPRPLAHLKGVEAVPAEVAGFLEELYVSRKYHPEPPLAKFADDKAKVMKLAEDVCSAFIPAPPPTTCNMRLCFDIPNGVSTEHGVPPDTVVRGDAASLSVFDRRPKGLGYEHWTWHGLAHGLPDEAYDVLTKQIGAAIALWLGDGKVRPLGATFHAASRDHTEYRPVLDRRRTLADGGTSFEVLLLEQPHHYGTKWLILEVMPMTSCILAMINKFLVRLKALKNNGDDERVASLCEGVLVFIRQIEEHADSQGARHRDDVLREFSDPEMGKVDALYSAWEESVGPHLKEAAEKRDIPGLMRDLEEWKRISKEWAAVAFKRLGKIAEAY